MKIIFFGTPEFAVEVLDAVHAAGPHTLACVVSQPDRPKGRNRRLHPTPVKACALRHGVPVLQPDRADAAFCRRVLDKEEPDLVLVAAYGQKLPNDLLTLPSYGCINVHASLLPKYRGAAPVHRAIMEGERQTGITFMQVSAQMDAGDILQQHRLDILEQETAGELLQRLAALAADTIGPFLHQLVHGLITPRPQDPSMASRAPKLDKEEGWIDWRLDARKIVRRIRGLTPWPGARSPFSSASRNGVVQVLRALPARGLGNAGDVLGVSGGGIHVGCGRGSIMVTRVKPQGKPVMDARSFANGYRIEKGCRFSTGASGRT